MRDLEGVFDALREGETDTALAADDERDGALADAKDVGDSLDTAGVGRCLLERASGLRGGHVQTVLIVCETYVNDF